MSTPSTGKFLSRHRSTSRTIKPTKPNNATPNLHDLGKPPIISRAPPHPTTTTSIPPPTLPPHIFHGADDVVTRAILECDFPGTADGDIPGHGFYPLSPSCIIFCFCWSVVEPHLLSSCEIVIFASNVTRSPFLAVVFEGIVPHTFQPASVLSNILTVSP